MMNAYEFTRMDIDFQSRIKAQAYEAKVLEMTIKARHDYDIREDEEYKDAHDTFIELTMSCTKEEAIWWMKKWMADAIAYGLESQECDWQHKFLAALDIFNSLTEKSQRYHTEEQQEWLHEYGTELVEAWRELDA